jgi:hypothetical protein
MRSRFIRLAASVVLLALLAACRPYESEVFVSNVGAEEIIALNKPRDLAAVTGLRIRIEGEIAGAAQLLILKDGKPHHVERLSGPVDIRWRDDWNEDRVRLHYLPGPKVSGTLRIRYRFVD